MDNLLYELIDIFKTKTFAINQTKVLTLFNTNVSQLINGTECDQTSEPC